MAERRPYLSMQRRGVSTIVGILVLAVMVTVAAGGVAMFFQSALEGVKDGPDVGFQNALEIVHVSCIGHEFRLTIRNAGDTVIDASSTQAFLYDNTGDLLQVTQEEDFSGKAFEEPGGVDTMTFTVPDAKPLTDEIPFEIAFQDEGVSGACSPEYDAELVAAWSFDEGDRNSTHAFDVVGGNNGALTGNPTFSGDGVRGEGIAMDGNDGIAIPLSDGLNSTFSTNPLTIMFWIEPTPDTSSWSNLFAWTTVNGTGDTHQARTEMMSEQNDSMYTRFIAYDTADPCSELREDGGFWARNADMGITPNAWNLYTVTYNGSAIVEYANGAIQEQYFANCDLATLASDITLSDLPNGQTLDDVRIYNRSLSSEEIRMDAVALTS